MSDAAATNPASPPDAAAVAPADAAPSEAAVVATPKAEVIQTEGGTPTSVRVKEPAVAYSTVNSSVYTVTAETVRAVKNFKTPDGFQQEGAREGSFLFSLGNYCKPVDLPKNNSYTGQFYCQASAACRSKQRMITCKNGAKSNANKHMREIHSLRGKKGDERDQTQQQQKTGKLRASVAASQVYEVGKKRVSELQAAKLAVEKMLPFNFFSTGEMFGEMMNTHGGGSTFPELTPRRVKHLITELYVATKKAVVENMLEEVKKATLPIVHHEVGAWTCKVSGRKFLGFHVHYVNSGLELKHALLSVKHYAPSQEALKEEEAGEVLLKIFESTLDEFGLTPANLASGTTESGSDMKALSINGLLAKYGVLWDRCPCHLAVKAAEQAFGVSADPAKSKNPDARDLLELVIKVIEKLNKSPSLKAKFDELQADMLNEVFKIAKHAPQRWLSLVDTLERIIRLWHVLSKFFVDEMKQFPLDQGDNKDGILQLYSLLKPVCDITRDGQFGNAPMTAGIHMKLGKLKMDVLDMQKDLKVYDIPALGDNGLPGAEEAKGDLPFNMVKPDGLHPVATRTREELSKAFVSRLYGRVWDSNTPDPSFFRDASVLLTPPFNGGHYLNAFRLTEKDADYLPHSSLATAPTTKEHVKEKLQGAWDGIKKRAVEALREKQARAGSVDLSGPFKRQRTSRGKRRVRTRVEAAGEDDDAFACFGHVGGAAENDEEMTDAVEREVSQELMRYQALFMSPKDVRPNDVLAYWGRSGKHAFPLLLPVVQQTFGNQASAAQIERDFSGCGILLVPNRSRIETYWVEMVMFLKANFKYIPDYKLIPQILAKDIRKCLPPRFDGRDQTLLDAEATIDPLINNTPPTRGAVDLDDNDN